MPKWIPSQTFFSFSESFFLHVHLCVVLAANEFSMSFLDFPWFSDGLPKKFIEFLVGQLA